MAEHPPRRLPCGCNIDLSYDGIEEQICGSVHHCPLHAAAPEMLAALKAYFEIQDTHHREGATPRIILAYRDCEVRMIEAIYKAEGK